MADDAKINEYVRLVVEEQYQRIDRKLQVEDLPNHWEQMNFRGALHSSSACNLAGRLHEVALEEKINTRLSAEREAHRMHGAALLEQRADLVERELTVVIQRDLADAFTAGPIRRDSERGYGNLISVVCSEILDRVLPSMRRRIRMLVMESRAPKPEATGATHSITFQGDNYGIVASRIDTLNVGAASVELRACLSAILDTTRDLTDAQRAEIGDLVQGLINEVEKGPDYSRGMVSMALQRIRTIATDTAVAITLGQHLDKLPALFAALRQLTAG